MHQTLASAVRALTAFPRFMPFPSAFISAPFLVHFRPISAFVSASKTRFHFRFVHFRSISGSLPLPFPLSFPLPFPLSFPAHFCFHFRFMSTFISGPFPVHFRFHVRYQFRSISAGAKAFPLSFVHFRKISGPFPVHCPFWQESAQHSILIRD